MPFSLDEQCDILRLFYKNNENSSAARREYNAMYPQRRVPSRNTFNNVQNRFRERKIMRRKRRAKFLNEDEELNILLHFEGNSGTPKRNQVKSVMRRQHTIANPGSSGQEHPLPNEGTENGRSISPGPSVCSDTDLPYISYTVNRPIGDSPKLANKQLIKSKSTTTRKSQVTKQVRSKNAHNIVVVRGLENNVNNTDKDPDVQKLQSIPMFLPIMRATLSLPAARDPEVLERLDPTPLRNLCLRYQRHLTAAANLVATEQNQLTQRVREVDSDIGKMVVLATDRQKKYAKYADKLSKVQELSHQLNRCHMILNQTLESMETLNNYLDIEDRLEPFVWTTG